VTHVRSNIVFFVLLGLFAVLGVGLATRSRTPHTVAPPVASASASAAAASGSHSADALPSASASGSAKATGGKDKALGRKLRVAALGWELVAPLALQNGGLDSTKGSELAKAGLDVGIVVTDSMKDVESALAKGGADADGADIAIVPLPSLIVAYERLQALRPVVFFVSAWSAGRDVVLAKQALDKLPSSGDIALKTSADASATMLALFALDLVAVDPARLRLGDRGDAKAELRAVTRASLSDDDKSDVVLSTNEASRLVPIVALSSASLQDNYPDTTRAWTKAWLEGARRLSADPSAAARAVSAMKDAPEPIALLSRLGEVKPVGLSENAQLMGLSGRDAISVESLSQRMWRLARSSKLVSVPPPERTPIHTRAIAALVRGEPTLARPDDSPTQGTKAPATAAAAKPVLTASVPGPQDTEVASAELGFVASAFHRSPIRVSAHRGGASDKKLTATIVGRTVDRYGLPAERLAVANLRPRGNPQLTIEVLPVP